LGELSCKRLDSRVGSGSRLGGKHRCKNRAYIGENREELAPSLAQVDSFGDRRVLCECEQPQQPAELGNWIFELVELLDVEWA